MQGCQLPEEWNNAAEGCVLSSGSRGMFSEQWQFLPHLDLSPGLLLDCYPRKQLGTKLSGVIKDAAGRVGWFGERFRA